MYLIIIFFKLIFFIFIFLYLLYFFLFRLKGGKGWGRGKKPTFRNMLITFLAQTVQLLFRALL